MKLISDLRAKQRLYSQYGEQHGLGRVILTDGTLANALYRLQQTLAAWHLAPCALLVSILNKWINGCVIGTRASFGEGLVLIHPIGVVVNSAVRAGKNVWIESSAVLGDNRGRSPVLGDDIFIGSGAKVIGGVHVGNGARVGANAVVVHDVLPGATVVGIPARPIERRANIKEVPSQVPLSASQNVLHVVDSLERGGLERVVADLAIAQREAGHGVAVFCLYRTGPIAQELEAAGIVVSCGDKRSGLDVRTIHRLRRAIRATSRTIVHAHNFVPSYYSAMARLLVFSAPILVCTCHDMGTRLVDGHLKRMFTWSLRRTARMAMVSDQVYGKYVSEGLVPAARAELILNGVPIHRFESSPDARERARRTLGLPPDAPVIGAVGRLVPLKNHHALIEAMPALIGSYPDLQLVILGDGELRDELSVLAGTLGVASHVHLPGARSDVAQLLPAFDVFTLPSTTEGLSIALLEAISANVAVVASTVGGNIRIVKPEATGLLVPPQDAAALNAALRRLLDSPALRQGFAKAARSWAEQHASIDAMQRAYDLFYARALSARRGLGTQAVKGPT